MPAMSFQPKAPSNDKTSLTDGWHPGYLLAISDEQTPPTWKMFEKSPRMYRWTFAVWQQPGDILHDAPERQSAPSSQAFSPKGTQPASKAYSWTSALLQRQIQPGESVDLDPMLPLPCRVKISRNGEYANILDLEYWAEGPPRTPELLAMLHTCLHREGTAPPRETAPTPAGKAPLVWPTQIDRPDMSQGPAGWPTRAAQPQLPGTPTGKVSW